MKAGARRGEWFLAVLAAVCVTALAAGAAQAKDYEVGPGKAFAALADVPWASLKPGDSVLVYWRSEPYREKLVINASGAEGAPITVKGVPNSDGQLPVLDGQDAKTVPGGSAQSESRGIILVGMGARASYLTIENLEIVHACKPYSFTGAKGAKVEYPFFTSCIWMFAGDHLTIRNCILHDSMIGLGTSWDTSDVLIEGCHLYNNSLEGDRGTHNSYTASAGITFQYNRYGKLRGVSSGNALKDRSAGTVVRYNWIEYGNRQLDLVDAQDNDGYLTRDPRYVDTFVYGNVLLEHGGQGDNNQIVHFGGDTYTDDNRMKGEWYRKNLYFYNNTVYSDRSGTTVLFRTRTADAKVVAVNNIFYTPGEGASIIVSEYEAPAAIALTNNWFKKGHVVTENGPRENITGDATSIEGEDPGFVDVAAMDLHLKAGSPCIDAGAALPAVALPANAVTMQYLAHCRGEARPSDGKLDIGAYEYAKPAAQAPGASTESTAAVKEGAAK